MNPSFSTLINTHNLDLSSSVQGRHNGCSLGEHELECKARDGLMGVTVTP